MSSERYPFELPVKAWKDGSCWGLLLSLVPLLCRSSLFFLVVENRWPLLR
jgi:hypothetical protein